MTFHKWLTANKHDLEGMTEQQAQRFCALLGRGHSVADLLAHYGEEFGHLPSERLRTLSRAYRAWQTWVRRRDKLQQARQQAGLPLLADRWVELTCSADQLDALVRTVRLCTEGDDVQCQQTVEAGLQLWRACVALARKEGSVRCRAKDLRHPDLARYDGHLNRSESLAKLAPHRWLALRRGEREGLLQLELELPQESFAQQLGLVSDGLTSCGVERSAASLLEELVLNDLRAWLLSMLDTEAEAKAVTAACESLAGLLRSPPLQARRVGSIFIGRPRSSVGMAIADREGDLIAGRAIKRDVNWIAKVVEFLDEHKVQHVTLPTSAAAAQELTDLDAELNKGGLHIQRVRTAALAEARLPLTEPPQRLGPAVASALVLARRALDPLLAWSDVDPVAIGVAEYQHDLNEERLRDALKETVEICRLERRRSRPAASGVRPGATGVRLNPLVQSVADLRPGMTVQGIVTNISHFGAFVNIGLAQEGLVHISELSDSFVSNPNEVVSIGQQVTANVLAAEPSRGRISLSMKRQGPSARRQGRPANKSGGGFSAQRPAPGTRAAALADLERLFKK